MATKNINCPNVTIHTKHTRKELNEKQNSDIYNSAVYLLKYLDCNKKCWPNQVPFYSKTQSTH